MDSPGGDLGGLGCIPLVGSGMHPSVRIWDGFPSGGDLRWIPQQGSGIDPPGGALSGVGWILGWGRPGMDLPGGDLSGVEWISGGIWDESSWLDRGWISLGGVGWIPLGADVSGVGWTPPGGIWDGSLLGSGGRIPYGWGK